MQLATVLDMTPSQTAALATVFRNAGHQFGPAPADEHAFVIQRLTTLAHQFNHRLEMQ